MLRLIGEFVDKYVGLHVRSLYNDSPALNFDIVKKTSHDSCLATITTPKFDAIVAIKKLAAAAGVAATSTKIVVDLYNRRMALC